METLKAGLEGVVVAETRLSDVDGANGHLIIAGQEVGTLAPNASFEAVCSLLWYGDPESETTIRAQFQARRALPSLTLQIIQAQKSEKTIDVLRATIAALPVTGDDHEDALTALALLPTIVAAHHRITNGQAPVPPHPDLPHAANYLYMLRGTLPTDAEARALETYLNTVVDHGLNASTFVARAIASTESDMISCLTGAIGALKGPLHGGAPGPALDMVQEIATLDRAEPYLREKLERGERLMGYGHRIYKVRDPRADVLATAAEQLYASGVDRSLYNLATGVEAIALRLLDEYKPGRNLKTNVEFYTALLLEGLGLPTDLFTPTFALTRAAGWSAHVMEQRQGNRVMRPQSRYIGRRP